MNPIKVDPELLPTHRELARASIVAATVALLLLVTAVLPAEAGVDPTGVGRWLGLTAMGELKLGEASSPPREGAESPATPPATSTAAVVAEAPGGAAAHESAYAFRSDELTLTLQPNEGAEIKAVMRSGDQLMYAWRADRGELYFDFHGEPKGAPADVFTSYEKGSTAAAEGGFEAPFEGVHGWYWKNRSGGVVTVTLNTSGVYASIARKM